MGLNSYISSYVKERLNRDGYCAKWVHKQQIPDVTVQGGNGNRFTSASNAFTRHAVLWGGNGWMPTFSGFHCPQMVNYYTFSECLRKKYYLAKSTALVSRITVILIWPG